MAILLYGILSKILEWMEWSGLDTPQTVMTTRATAVLKFGLSKFYLGSTSPIMNKDIQLCNKDDILGQHLLHMSRMNILYMTRTKICIE